MKETSKTTNRDALIAFIKMLTPAEIDKLCKHKRLLEIVGRSSENDVVFLEALAEKLLFSQRSA